MEKRNLIFFIFIIILNAFFNTKFQLHYDEAYYWAFSQKISLSYFDHPPMIAYLIKLFSFLGHSGFAVRFTGLVTTSITVIMIFKLTYRMWGRQTANIALFLALCSPLIEAVFFIASPDSPLIMFWTLTLYCIYRGVFENNKKFIYLAGVYGGLGLLSKYTMVLIFPSIFLFLIFSKTYRKLLTQKDIYLSLLIAILIFSPVIYWNYTHNWESFLFQFNHGIDFTNRLNIGCLLDYLGGQLIISGIFIFLPLLYFLFYYIKFNLKDDKLSFLTWSFLLVFSFFGWRALFQHMEANWPASGYISGLILVSYWIDKLKINWIKIASLCLFLIMLIPSKMPLFFIPKKFYNWEQIKVINMFYGTNELLHEIQPYIKSNNTILACDYGNASRAWFYLNIEQVYVMPNFKFAHMYKYWTPPHRIVNGIYICDNDDNEAMVNLKSDFKQVNLLRIAKYSNVVGERYMYIYEVKN